MTFLKDDEELLSAQLAPSKMLTCPSRAPANQAAMVGVHNRLGGLLQEIERRLGLSVPAMLAVWLVESSGIPFIQRQAMIRFEVHKLFEIWGKRSRPVFDTHFRFGGHNQQGGKPWENQEYRPQDVGGNFLAVHHNQSSEYATLTLARLVSSDDEALQCISIGGCQIMLNAYGMLGYGTPRQMYTAFQNSERYHVLGFLDFCRNKPAPQANDLPGYIKQRDWSRFAQYYNGAGQMKAYETKLQAMYELACELVTLKAA